MITTIPHTSLTTFLTISLTPHASRSGPLSSNIQEALLAKTGKNEGGANKPPQKKSFRPLELAIPQMRTRRSIESNVDLEIQRLAADYRSRRVIISLLMTLPVEKSDGKGLLGELEEKRDGKNVLEDYLNNLSKEEFRRVLTREIFECLPPAILFSVENIKSLPSEEQRSWLPYKQRTISTRDISDNYIRTHIIDLILADNESELKNYLGGLSKKVFQRILTRDIFEYLPRAIFSTKIVRKQLSKKHRSWLSDQQRDIFNSPQKCMFMGSSHFSRGLKDKEALSSIEEDETMSPNKIMDKIGAFLYPDEDKQTRIAHWRVPNEYAEIHRYLQECRPHWSAALQRAKA